ncbi:MAG: LamG-like jellyroll fold domain-containing protein, partial [Pseudomonadota bacterium]
MKANQEEAPLVVGIPLFQGVTLLDFTGATQVFAWVPGMKVVWLAECMSPVVTSEGVSVLPHATFDDARKIDILFMPGGSGEGITYAMQNEKFQQFIKSAGADAQWVGSVCVGAFVLAAAGLFDGTGDYLTLDGSSDFAFGNNDFTIECRIRLAAIGTQYVIYDSRPASTNGAYAMLQVKSDNKLYFTVDSTDRVSGATALVADTWYHVVVSRKSGITRMFLDGNQEGSDYADSNVYLNGASRPAIGGSGETVGSLGLNGWLDEMHVANGVARWDDVFTPPAVAYNEGDTYITITPASATTLDYLAIAAHNLGNGGHTVSV